MKIITKVFDKTHNRIKTPNEHRPTLHAKKVSPVSFDSVVYFTHAINMSEMIFKLLIYFIIATNVSRTQRNI